MSPKPTFLRVGAGNPTTTATQISAAPPLRSPAEVLGLSTAPAEGPSVVVDHAVFTSIRSHTGEGYRIIAATPGLRPDEKAEITRRSPSHGSLCSESADALGLSSYELTSGRHCVALHCHAGVEHTARGGHRVYTQLVVMDDPTFGRFGCDPLRVFNAIARAMGDRLVLKMPTRVEGMRLALPSRADVAGPGDAAFDQLRFLSIACAQKSPRAICTPTDGLTLLAYVMRLTPAVWRKQCSCTIGVRFSPSRPVRMVLVPRDSGETARAVRGVECEYVDLAAGTPGMTTQYDPWFDFIRRRIKAGRWADLVELTDEITTPHAPDTLERIGELCDALERVGRMDAQALEMVRSRYVGTLSDSPVEASRLAALREAIDRRAAELGVDMK